MRILIYIHYCIAKFAMILCGALDSLFPDSSPASFDAPLKKSSDCSDINESGEGLGDGLIFSELMDTFLAGLIRLYSIGGLDFRASLTRSVCERAPVLLKRLLSWLLTVCTEALRVSEIV